jgi:hypothetical protein
VKTFLIAFTATLWVLLVILMFWYRATHPRADVSRQWLADQGYDKGGY